MADITLNRTGLPDLTFTGEQIGQGGGRPTNAKPEWTMRWHVVTLYRTQGQALVAHVEYHTEIDRETNVSHVFTAPDGSRPGPLIDQLAEYDPYEFVDRYPDHPRWHKREERRAALITARYDEACQDAYAAAGIVESID